MMEQLTTRFKIMRRTCVPVQQILVVDADEGLRNLVRMRLMGQGYAVECFSSGAAALAHLEEDPNHLIISDYKLPDMTARNILALLKERELNIPVIIMTGCGNEQIAADSMRQGARDYLIKDGNFLELLTGAVERVVKTVNTESRLRKAEEEIRRLSIFPESNPNPIAELDCNGEIKYLNRAARELVRAFSLDAPEELFPPDAKSIASDCLSFGKGRRHLDRIIKGRTVAWSFYPIAETGTVHCYGSEITEKRKLEKQLTQSQKMEAVGILAGGIAHDFNNLLTAIKGYTDLALRRVNESDPLYNDLDEIKDASERASKLTRQLLVFSRSEEVTLKPMDLNKTVHEVTTMLQRLLGEDIRLVLALDPDLTPINADEGNMEQIIMNLCVNARDAMPGGGDLIVRTSIEVIGTEQSRMVTGAVAGRFVCLEIGDTGCGMDKETVSRIFEPFFTTKGQAKGTGLGLSMVYGIVKQHNGWLNVDSVPGKGTSFKIYFPMVSADLSRAGSEVIAPADYLGANERILLIEDEDSVREFAGRALLESGYTLFAARNVKEAKQIFEAEHGHFDLVFSDVILPDGRGPDMVKEWLEQKPDLKVLFGSGYTGTKSQFFYISQEGFTYLQKPYDLKEMLVSVKKVIGENNA